MDKYIELARASIKYYLEKSSYLQDFDSSFCKNNNGVIVRITNGDREKGRAGSIYPTRKNIGLDIIYESVSAGFFDKVYLPITKENLKNHKIQIYEFEKVERIQYIEDFDSYDGIVINYMEQNFMVFRKDYKSDRQMFEAAIKEANLDSWDIFSIDKFKMILHE